MNVTNNREIHEIALQLINSDCNHDCSKCEFFGKYSAGCVYAFQAKKLIENGIRLDEIVIKETLSTLSEELLNVFDSQLQDVVAACMHGKIPVETMENSMRCIIRIRERINDLISKINLESMR